MKPPSVARETETSCELRKLSTELYNENHAAASRVHHQQGVRIELANCHDFMFELKTTLSLISNLLLALSALILPRLCSQAPRSLLPQNGGQRIMPATIL
jgi:hypothetical protein